jgi:hypothetical protein
MSIPFGSYSFEGPHPSTRSLRNAAGLYVILDCRSSDDRTVIDVGESDTVRDGVERHERADCWCRYQRGQFGVAVLYTPGWAVERRRAVERHIREAYAPPCGEE